MCAQILVEEPRRGATLDRKVEVSLPLLGSIIVRCPTEASGRGNVPPTSISL